MALVASLVGGFFAQELGKAGGKVFYDQFGSKVDLIKASRVDQLCR